MNIVRPPILSPVFFLVKLFSSASGEISPGGSSTATQDPSYREEQAARSTGLRAPGPGSSIGAAFIPCQQVMAVLTPLAWTPG